MTKPHPLTDEMMDEIKMNFGGLCCECDDSLNMRAAFDKGAEYKLEQVVKWLDDNIYDYKYVSCSEPVCEWVNTAELLRDLKIAMRPNIEKNQ